MTRLVLAMLLIFNAGFLFANPKAKPAKATITTLLMWCGETMQNESFNNFCEGYLNGVRDTAYDWCLQGKVTESEFRSLIIAELRLKKREAEDGSISASDTILKIISDRWPCD